MARASTAADSDDAANRLIARGNEAEKDGKLREACELYRKALKAAPGYAKAHLNLGIGLEAAGDIDGAKASCKSCHDQYKAKYKAEVRDRPF